MSVEPKFCCVCPGIAFYRVYGRGFCEKHKEFAIELNREIFTDEENFEQYFNHFIKERNLDTLC